MIGAAQGVLAHEARPGPRGQVEQLAPALEACLGAAKLRWADLSRIAAVRGPGTFVGVRVGVAAARGLAFGTSAPAVGLDGFDVAALSAQRRGARGKRVALVFGAGDRLIWRTYSLTHIEALPLADYASGDRRDLDLLDVDARIGPAVDAAWPGADPGALLELALAAPLAPPSPFYARPPDAAPPSRQPVRRRATLVAERAPRSETR